MEKNVIHCCIEGGNAQTTQHKSIEQFYIKGLSILGWLDHIKNISSLCEIPSNPIRDRGSKFYSRANTHAVQYYMLWVKYWIYWVNAITLWLYSALNYYRCGKVFNVQTWHNLTMCQARIQCWSLYMQHSDSRSQGRRYHRHKYTIVSPCTVESSDSTGWSQSSEVSYNLLFLLG